VLRRRILAFGPCILWSPLGGAPSNPGTPFRLYKLSSCRRLDGGFA
jgi:hypothetical protein